MEGIPRPVIPEGITDDGSEEPIIDGDAGHSVRRLSPSIGSSIPTPSQHSRSSSYAIEYTGLRPTSPIWTRHNNPRPRAKSTPPFVRTPTTQPPLPHYSTELKEYAHYSAPSLGTTELTRLRRPSRISVARSSLISLAVASEQPSHVNHLRSSPYQFTSYRYVTPHPSVSVILQPRHLTHTTSHPPMSGSSRALPQPPPPPTNVQKKSRTSNFLSRVKSTFSPRSPSRNG